MAEDTKPKLTTAQVQEACSEARARLVEVKEEPEVGTGKLVVQSYEIVTARGRDVSIEASSVGSVAELAAALKGK